MWAGRSDGATDKIADDFNSSLPFDCRMYAQDISQLFDIGCRIIF